MKSLYRKIVFTAILFFLSSVLVFAQEKIDEQEMELEIEEDIPDEMSDLDDIFAESQDTAEPIITEPEPQNASIPESRKGIIFSGNINARLGGEVYYPLELYPGAIFESKIAFSARPNDTFSIKGMLLVKFPKMELGLYELYMNYNFWNVAYLVAGKKELSWGNGRIFDTNILDDRKDYQYNPEDLLLNKEIKQENSKFVVQLDVPLWKFNIEGLVYYEQFKDKNGNDIEFNAKNIADSLCYAVKLDANIWNFAFDAFWKSWANADPYGYPQAVGCDVNFQIADLHVYGQYFTHLQEINGKWQNPRSKGTASVWWATQEKINLGFLLEYQIVYDYTGLDNPNPESENWDSSKFIKQYIAFQAVWGRIGGSKITGAVKYFHDFYEQYGTVIPGLKIHEIVPNADLDIGIPIYYGSKRKVGVAIQVTLNLDY